jgi:hypothetical protein
MAGHDDVHDAGGHRIIVVAGKVNIAVSRFGKRKRVEYVTVGGARIDVSEFGASAVRRIDARAYRFPPGHPQEGVAYVANPVDADVFYTFAEFQQRVFESKVLEAMELLAALGARSVTIHQSAGKQRDVGATIGASVPGAVGVGGALERETSSHSEVRYAARFTPSRAPHIPDGLRWYEHEPVWENIATMRLHHGMTEFNFDVRFETNYGVSAELGAKIAGKGVSVGGKVSEFISSTWTMSGQF